MGWLWIPFGLKPKRDEERVKYADVYARAVAAAVDVFLLFFLLNGVFRYVATHIYAGADAALFEQIQQTGGALEVLSLIWNSPLMGLWLFNALIQFAIVGVLILFVQMRYGTTPGKWLLGLKIVDAKTLEPITSWRFLIRFLAYIPAMLPLMLGIFWSSFNKQHRGWHDYIAGTAVIHTRSYTWYKERLLQLYRRVTGKQTPPDAG